MVNNMATRLKRDSNSITIAGFWENIALKKYNFSPAYQRDSVWDIEKQSFFIDSLLKNCPIPPIFLHQKIDESSGRTTFDVIDGKQRLTSIIKFIENKIPASDEFADGPLYDAKIAGVYFKDLDSEELKSYKSAFWRYSIPIEYIDSDDKTLIDNIFDRLNRNGEKLEGQELRRASYHNTDLLKFIERIADEEPWSTLLSRLKTKRMEHYEFISEILFQQIEKKVLHADQKAIDALYKQYATTDITNTVHEDRFIEASKYLLDLGLDFESYKVSGVSHLYGIWCLVQYCLDKKIDAQDISGKLNEFYYELRNATEPNRHVAEYKKSMSSRTRDQSQRRKRMESLISYLDI